MDKNSEAPGFYKKKPSERLNFVKEFDNYLKKLREISIAYNFGRSSFGFMGDPIILLRLSAQDLVTWTNYSGWDPETNMYQDRISGEDYFNQPQTWRVNLGVQLEW